MCLADGVTQALGGLQDKDQVNMIGHQAICPDRDLLCAAELRHELEVVLVVFLTEECLLSAVSPLGDMVGHARSYHTMSLFPSPERYPAHEVVKLRCKALRSVSSLEIGGVAGACREGDHVGSDRSARRAGRDLAWFGRPAHTWSLIMVFQKHIQRRTSGHRDMHDLTGELQQIVEQSGIQRGIACLCNVGSTAALGTIEFEPGLEEDLPELLDRLIPPSREYGHERAWHDGNGHSHLQATLLGPSLTVPIEQNRLVLGTWQQVFLLECDVRSRQRSVAVTVIGE